jgi:hypothetical protein
MTVIKYFKIGLLFLLALGLIWCGGKDTATADQTTTDQPSGSQQQAVDRPESATRQTEVTTSGSGTEAEQESDAVIKAITFSPAILRTNSDIEVNVDLGEAEGQGYILKYVFWKNGKKIHESDEGKLEKAMVKRGDFLQVQVMVFDAANEELDNHRSNMFEVLNSPPVIKKLVIPQIKGFGLYTFTVETEDADQDTLTFSLEGQNLPQGLQLDNTSGTVTYQFSDPPPEKLSFVLVADDGNGGKAKKSVSMTFKKQENRKDQT